MNVFLEVASQIKNITPPLSQCLWSQELSGRWNTATSSHSLMCITPQWGGHGKSLDNLNTLYLHLYSTHEQQTRQSAACSKRLPSLKPYDLLITWHTWGYVTNWIIYISIIKKLMISKPGKVLTYGKRFSTQTLKSLPTSCSHIWLLTFSKMSYGIW